MCSVTTLLVQAWSSLAMIVMKQSRSICRRWREQIDILSNAGHETSSITMFHMNSQNQEERYKEADMMKQ